MLVAATTTSYLAGSWVPPGLVAHGGCTVAEEGGLPRQLPGLTYAAT